MPVAADFHHSGGFLLGLLIVSALGVLGGLLRAGVRAHALRVLGMVALLGMLSACSAPTNNGGGEARGKAKGRETPQERYFDQVYALVENKWKLYRAQSPNDRAYGSLRVLFYVGQEGKVEQIHVKNNQDTDPVLTRFTVKAIQDAKLPPMPEEVIPLLKYGPEMGMEFGILIRLKPKAEGGSSASGGMQMEKRWGLPPVARGGSARRGLRDEMSVNLTSKESGARQVNKPQPSTPPTKGGTRTTVKLTQTPKERYIQRVNQAVEKKWQKYRMMELAGITYGSLKVEFYVNKQGQVEDPRVVEDKNSYRALTLFTLRAIKDADIPRMPLDVIPSLPMNDPERLKIEYNVLIY